MIVSLCFLDLDRILVNLSSWRSPGLRIEHTCGVTGDHLAAHHVTHVGRLVDVRYVRVL